MATYTWNAIYIGTYADMDTNESSTTNEAKSILLGVHGTAADPLANHIVSVTATDLNNDHYLGRNNNGATPEPLKINGVSAALDTAVTYNATLTYADGTTAKITAVVFQTTDGKVYLAPETSNNTDTDALQAKAIKSINFTSVKQDSTTFRAQRVVTNFVCFTNEISILTDHGPMPAGDLTAGKMILTHDSGMQPVRWIGKKQLSRSALAANPKLLPVRIRAGALGSGLPLRDMLVSPQHRLMVRSVIALRMFGCAEVFVAAVKLIGLPGITQAANDRDITYVHFALDRHEVVYANGAMTESLLLGPETFKALGKEAGDEVRRLFPDLPAHPGQIVPARMIPSGADQKHLIERHLRNKKPLFDMFLPQGRAPGHSASDRDIRPAA